MVGTMNTSDLSAAEHWDARYRERESIWSGNVNATLASALAEIGALTSIDAPGNEPRGGGASRPRSLDLGCGEGGDVLWLAARGFEAMGVDISAVAVSRAAERAAREGVEAHFEAADLESWNPAEGRVFDLITASYFQSHVSLDRAAVLARAATWLAPGGHLVALSHAAPPPWARRHFEEAADAGHAHAMPALDGERAIFAGVPHLVEVIGEVRAREAHSPDGERAVLEDLLVVMRRS